jgi:hypothetical protein
MSKVLTDVDPGFSVEKKIEKEVPARKLPEEPKLSVSQTLQPVGLTLKSPPARGGLSKFVVVCLLFFGLGWLGFQPNVEKWIGSSVDSISATVRNFLVPTSTPVSRDPASPVDPDRSSTGPKPQGLSDEKDMRVPQLDGVESSATSGGHN